MNLFLAFFIFTIMHIVGVGEPLYKKEPPQIGFVEKGSAAAAAGIRKGDMIRTIDHSSIENWGELELTISTNPNVEIMVEFERGEKLFKEKLNVKSISKYSLGDAGIHWDFKSQFTGVLKDSPADKAGIEPDDILLAIDNTPVHHFEMADVIAGSVNRPLLLQIKRGEEEREIEVVPRKVYFLESRRFDSLEIAKKKVKGLRGAFPTFDFNLFLESGKYVIISRDLDTREEAEKYPGSAGFKLSVNSKMRNFFSRKIPFKHHILGETPFPILFRCMFSCIRPISIYFDIVLGQPGLPCRLTVKEKGVIGVEREAYWPSITTSYGLFPAMKKSVDKIGSLTFLVFDVFKKMIVGRLSPKTLSGPIEIAKFSRKALESGLPSFFLLIAIISLQLGIINLFPIPALDGGHLLVFSIEAVIRREFSQKVKGILMNIGFFIIIALMVFVILNDLAKAGIISLPF